MLSFKHSEQSRHDPCPFAELRLLQISGRRVDLTLNEFFNRESVLFKISALSYHETFNM